MSDDLGTASLGTEVDLSGLERGLSEAEKTTRGGLLDLALITNTALGNIFADLATSIGGALMGAGVRIFDTASAFRDAQGQFQSDLGVTADEAARLGDVAREVFGNNFGDSVEDVGQSIIDVRQQMKGLADEELAGATESALALRDAFGFEVTESTNAANLLMEKFGLTSQQAFDFITKGQQAGLNASGDFLETITEYGNLMSDNGFSADQFFSIMESGLQSGVLGTDKAADAFKEFGIITQELTEDVWGPDGVLRNTFEMSNEEIDHFFNGLQDGSVTVADFYNEVAPRLAAMENDVYRNSAGVALFGTMWEDMGADAMLAIDPTLTSMADMAGATESLNAQYTSLGGVWEGVSRGFLLALEPLGAVLLDLANVAMPYLLAGAEQLRAGIETAIGFIGPFIQNTVSFVSGLFAGEGATGPSAWGAAFEQARLTIEGVMNGVMGIVQPILTQLSAFWATHGTEIQNAAGQAWNQIGTIIGSTLEVLNATVIPTLTAIGGFISAHSDDIQAVLGFAWTYISTTVDTTLKNIQGIINTVLALIKGDWSGAWTEIQGIAERTVGAAQKIIETAITTAHRIWKNNSDEILKVAKDVWGGVESAITGAVEPITTAIDTLVGKLGEGLRGAVSAASGYFEPLGRAIGAVKSIVEDTIRVVQGLIDKFKNLVIPPALQQHSPSPFEQSIIDLGAAMDGTASAAAAMAAAVTDQLSDAAGEARKFVDEIMSGLVGQRRASASAVEFLREAQEAVVEAEQRRAEISRELTEAQAAADAGETGAQERLIKLQQASERAGREYATAAQQFLLVQQQIEQAQADALAVAELDPTKADDFLQMRQRQIAELNKLQTELENETEPWARDLLAQQLALIQEAQAAEIEQFYQRIGASAADLAAAQAEFAADGAIIPGDASYVSLGAATGEALAQALMTSPLPVALVGADGAGGMGAAAVDVNVTVTVNDGAVTGLVDATVEQRMTEAGRNAQTRNYTR